MVIYKFCKEEINKKQRNCGDYHWQCKDFCCINAGGLQTKIYLKLYGLYEPEKDKAELYIKDVNGYHIDKKE